MTRQQMTNDPLGNAPGMVHMRFLQSVRQHELTLALAHFPPPISSEQRKCKVLEIGAGTGQQAMQISKIGYDVMAIDVKSSHYRTTRTFDVIEYDGISIPAADSAFDVIFSSNVLEHIASIDEFLDETLRVMAKDGMAIHILPTAITRFWGIPAHYVWLTKRVLARIFSRRKRENSSGSLAKPRTPANIQEWVGTLFPMRHGERGNTLTEVFYFSRWWWTRKFSTHGLKVINLDSNHLFYTLANSMADAISLSVREKLSAALGSACTIYVLKRA